MRTNMLALPRLFFVFAMLLAFATPSFAADSVEMTSAKVMTVPKTSANGRCGAGEEPAITSDTGMTLRHLAIIYAQGESFTHNDVLDHSGWRKIQNQPAVKNVTYCYKYS